MLSHPSAKELRESGWLSGKKLEFYPSNLGSAPTWEKYHKKKIKTHLVCLK